MKDTELRAAPPIPPRRLKRKNKSVVGATDGVEATVTNSDRRVEPRPRLPPPPPPQRGLPRREVQSRLPRPSVPGNDSPSRLSDERHSRSIVTGDEQLVDEVPPTRFILPEILPRRNLPLPARKHSSSTFGSNVRLPLARAERKATKSKIARPNVYPPLFFTLQDFQEVMGEAEKSYSRTLTNMTTFEPTPKPRALVDLPDSPKGPVLFRVTTTNVPFEKCHEKDPGQFVFEDYVDRRQIPLQSRTSATKLILFGDDTFDKDDEDRTLSATRTASRVRFLVDSPSEDGAAKISEFDSLQNIESLPADDFEVDHQPLQDEFGDVPFDSLISAVNDDSASSSVTDFQTILVTAMVEPIPRVLEQNSDNEKTTYFTACDSPTVNEVEIEKEAEEDVKDIEESFETREDERNLDNCEDLMIMTEPPTEKNVRRNSFLRDMLQSEGEPEERMICEVVATHPKTSEPQGAFEAKSKVLEELSSSFSAIRLRPVAAIDYDSDKQLSGSESKIDSTTGEGESREDRVVEREEPCDLDSTLDSNVVKCNVIEEPIEETGRSQLELQDRCSNVCSQKTDELIRINVREDNVELIEKCEENETINNNDNNNNDNIDESGDVSGTKTTKMSNNSEITSRSNVDKCAIVLQCNNNNDNNATTPVDVSSDQSPKVVSIIPGSVRSFVKFYEIQGETNVGLSASEIPKTKLDEETIEADIEVGNSRTLPIATNETDPEIENDVKYTIVKRKPMQIQPGTRLNVDLRTDLFDDKGNEPPLKFSKTEKRAAQFSTVSALWRSTSVDQDEQGNAPEAAKKRREDCTSRPSLLAKKTTKLQPRTGRGVALGKTSGMQVDWTAATTPRDVVRSGTTIQSVPKTSTSTTNDQFTFYCTV